MKAVDTETSALMDVAGVIIRSPRRASLERLSVRVPAGLVEVDVAVCALCTWEQRVFRGVRGPLPFWGGHEVVGTVAAAGPLQGEVSPGDHVLLGLMKRCGWCAWCRRGLNNHCAYARPAQPDDAAPPGPRGLSSRIAVPPEAVFRLHPSVPLSVGALGEPLSCVLHSVRRSGLEPGAVAMVIGDGTMGLLHAAVLHARGVKVIQMSVTQAPLPVNRLAWPVLEQRLALDEVVEQTSKEGVGAVFCTQGGAASVALALKAIRRGGTVILFESIAGDEALMLPANDLRARELNIVGSLAQTQEDMMLAATLLHTRPEIASCLQTEVVPAHDVQRAFELAVAHRVSRVLVDFND